MYPINPAVIKSILSSMPKEEFYRHARFIRRKAYATVSGTNLHAIFVNLYRWCRLNYRLRFLTKQQQNCQKH